MATLMKIEGTTALVDVGDLSPFKREEILSHLDDISVLFKSKSRNVITSNLKKLLLQLQNPLSTMVSRHHVGKGKRDTSVNLKTVEGPSAKRQKRSADDSRKAVVKIPARETRSRTGSLKNKSAVELLGLTRVSKGKESHDEDDSDASLEIAGEIRSGDDDGKLIPSDKVEVGKGGSKNEKKPKMLQIKKECNVETSETSNLNNEQRQQNNVADTIAVSNVKAEESPNKAGQERDEENSVYVVFNSSDSKTGSQVVQAVAPPGDIDEVENQGSDTSSSLNKIQRRGRGRPARKSQGTSSSRTDSSEHDYTPVKESKFRPRQEKPKEERFKCEYCSRRYMDDEHDLKYHLKCHIIDKDGKVEEKFQCTYCDKQVTRWHELVNHVVTHEQARIELKNAAFLKHILGLFRCQDCNKIFDLKANLLGHRTRVHNVKSDISCEYCGKQLGGKDYKTVQRHRDKCKNVSYQCDKCLYKTTIRADYKNHLRSHDGAFTCHICKETFRTMPNLWQHKKKVHEGFRFNEKIICEYCGQEYAGKLSLQQHVARHHSATGRIYACKLCKFTTAVEKDLERHSASVHNKKYKCPEAGCDFQTNAVSVFKLHQTYHAPSCIRSCQEAGCYFRAPTQQDVQSHYNKIHKPGTKVCPVCQNKFKSMSQLLRHVVMHSGTQAYGCEECGMRFQSHSTYYRHKRKTGHDADRKGVTSVPNCIMIEYSQGEASEGSVQYVQDVLVDGTGSAKSENVPSQTIYVKADHDAEDKVQYVVNLLHGSELQAVEDSESLEALASLSAEYQELVVKSEDTDDSQNNNEDTEDSNEVSQFDASANTIVVVTSDDQAMSEPKEEVEGNQGEQRETESHSAMQAGNHELLTGKIVHVTEESEIEAEGDMQEVVTQDNEVTVDVEHLQGLKNSEFRVATSTASGGEQIIYVMAPPGSEPEAALSMLQLQSGSSN